MSERLKSTGNISNEEIIDDLTKNLELSINASESKIAFDPNVDVSSEGVEKQQTSAVPPQQGKKQDETVYRADIDRDDSEEESRDDEDDDGSVDEVSLKDAEVDLTDDEKAERQIRAEAIKMSGNEAFQVADYQRSIEKYTEALRICPLQFDQQRAVLYCNRGAAKMKLKRYKPAIKDCTKAIELNDKYLKAYFRRAQSYELTKLYDESLEDYKKIVELDPDHADARQALVRLPGLINERNEKLKTEMMGKLKDLGNMLLKPFGLSTDNFKLEQDPNSDGYKINFSK